MRIKVEIKYLHCKKKTEVILNDLPIISEISKFLDKTMATHGT